MKRLKNKWVISIFVIIMVIGGVLMTQRKTPFDIFLTKDYTKATKEEQIAYLKKHEQKMTDFIKSQNAKVTSVQWDWDSVKVEEVKPNAGGFPTGDTYNVMLINGRFNDIKDSHFEITWQLSKNSYYPKISAMFLTQDLTIDGGSNPYE